MSDGQGIPVHLVAAGANRHDAPLLAPAVAGLDRFGPLTSPPTLHLDRRYGGAPTLRVMAGRHLPAIIARKASLIRGD